MDQIKFLAGRANWIRGVGSGGGHEESRGAQGTGRHLISLSAGDPDPNLIPREALGELAGEILQEIPPICDVHSCKRYP